MNAVSRQWRLVRTALAEEKAHFGRLQHVDDVSFLPAALEIIERPVSPTARATTWAMLIGLAIAIIWAVFGQIDIVASAPGRIVPTDNVKLVQPAEAGIVRAIHVRDGQIVQKGQILVELDPTVSTAEASQAKAALQNALFDVARAQAVLSALDGHGLAFKAPAGASEQLVATQRALASSEFSSIEAETSGRSADLLAAKASRAEALVQAAKLTETLPLLDDQLQAYESLLAKGYAAKLKVLEMRRQRLAISKDRDAAMATANRTAAQSSSANSLAAQNRAEARTKILTELAQAEADVELRREELVKSHQRSSIQRLVAPATGTITQLSIHTIGGVVEPAKPIMLVVPAGRYLNAEVKLLNRDAGFVHAGQDVAIKLEAFPFTRYGTLSGQVESISTDAVEDEKLGLVYTARIRLKRTSLMAGSMSLPVGSGMAVTADVLTGRRSILSFLISPIEKVRREAARDR
jgi:hemolysin D